MEEITLRELFVLTNGQGAILGFLFSAILLGKILGFLNVAKWITAFIKIIAYGLIAYGIVTTYGLDHPIRLTDVLVLITCFGEVLSNIFEMLSIMISEVKEK